MFGFRGFNSGAGGNFTVLVKFDLDEFTAGTRPNIAGQVDNVAITPASQFSAPRVPEPGSLAVLALTGAGLLVRRRTA